MKKRVIILSAFLVFAAGGSVFGAVGDLYNIDFEQLSSQGTYKQQMVGPGPDGGVGDPCDYWNVLEISEDGTGTPLGMGLLDSSGAASGVSFTFTSITDAGGAALIGAYGHSPTAINDLVAEYMFFGPQFAVTATLATWEITGLTAGGSYDIYLYTGGYDAVNGGNNAAANLDGDGAGDGWFDISPGTPVPTKVSVVADGSGVVHGDFGPDTGEDEIGGMQIIEVSAFTFYNLTMASNPGDPNAGPDPAAGVHSIVEDSTVNISANSGYLSGSTLYLFNNWSTTGDAPADPCSASTSVVITQDTTLTANFVNSGAPPFLVNVDFEQLSSEGTYKEQMVGVGPDGGLGYGGGYWNVFEASEAGTVPPVGMALMNGANLTSGVTFTFTSADGTYGLAAYGHSPTASNALVGEYIFLGAASPVQDTTVADFSITGLTPSQYYDMYLYSGGPAASGGYPGSSCEITLDLDGDGSLGDESPVTIGETLAPTVSGAIASGSGVILGRFSDNGGSESEWAGFQLAEGAAVSVYELTIAGPTDPNAGLSPVPGVYNNLAGNTVNLSTNLTYTLAGDLYVFMGWGYTGDEPNNVSATSTFVTVTQTTTITANYTNFGPPPNPNVVVNVDFESLSNDGGIVEGSYKVQMVGPGPNGGIGDPCDFWNVFEMTGAAGGTGVPVGMALKNDANAPSGVTFTFTAIDAGGLGAWGHSPTAIDDLTAEYMFLGPQNGTDVADWEITGLAASTSYSLYLYTGGYDAVNGPAYNADYDLDLDGDGSLDGVGTITGGTNAPTVIASVTTDGTGKIIGQFLHRSGQAESEIGGFQLGEVVSGFDLTINAPALAPISPGPGVHNYPLGTIVSIDSGGSYWDCDNDNLMLFDHWEGDASGSSDPVEVIMVANKAVTAVYVADGSYVPACGDYCYPNIPGDPVDDCVINLVDIAFLADIWLTDNRP